MFLHLGCKGSEQCAAMLTRMENQTEIILWREKIVRIRASYRDWPKTTTNAKKCLKYHQTHEKKRGKGIAGQTLAQIKGL